MNASRRRRCPLDSALAKSNDDVMRSYGRTRKTSAPAERVWTIWSDPVTWPEWNPSCTAMDLDGKLAEGTTGRMHTPQGRTHDVSFHNIEEGKSYEMDTKVIPGTTFHFRCEVSPADSGSTINQTVRITGPLAFLLAPLAGPGMAKSFDKVLDGLKQKVETAD